VADAISFATTSNSVHVPLQTVYAKAAWADDWVEQPHLYCTLCKWSLSPEIPTATLVWRYGVGQRPGDGIFVNVARKSLSRYYVKISYSHADFTSTNDWYGGIEIEGDSRGGSDVGGIATGVQEFVCFGLERLLDIHTIRRSFWVDQTNKLQVSNAAFAFNANGAGNMADAASRRDNAIPFDGGADTVDDLTGGYWDSLEIVNYLLEFDAPMPEDLEEYRSDPFSEAVEYQTPRVQMALDPTDKTVIPDFDRPVVTREGAMTLEVLNTVLARQRLLGYDIRVEDNAVYVHPCSFLDSDLVLEPWLDTYSGNQNLKKLVLANDASANVVVQKSSVDVVDVVTVRGAKRRSCFTVSYDDSTITSGWTSADQTDYNNGASTASSPAYPGAANVDERQKRNASARAVDKLRDVYARFVLVDNWNLKANDGQNGLAEANVVFPLGDGGLAEDAPYRAYPPGIKLLPTLPLLSHHDYSGTNIKDETHVVPTGDAPYQELPPIVLTPLLDDTNFYVHVENVGIVRSAYYAGTGDDRNWSGSVIVEPDSRSIRVQVTGAPQHKIAKNEFSPVDSSDWAIDRWDWQDFIFTIAVEDERYCEAHYPHDEYNNVKFPTGVDAARTLVINVGDGYRQDWVVKETVVGVDGTDGTLIRTTSGGYIRDDRQPMQDLARVAYEWYKDERIALEWTTSVYKPFRETVDSNEVGIRVGDMVTTVEAGTDQITANTVVTSIQIESPISADAQPGVPRITYATQYADLDPVRFFGV